MKKDEIKLTLGVTHKDDIETRGNILADIERRLLRVLRMDLQLHFFWSFSLTLLGVYLKPLLLAGLVVTIGKEVFDVVAQKGWSWGDFWFGISGACAAVLFLYTAFPGLLS